MGEPLRKGERWTRHEDITLIGMVAEGKTNAQIAEALLRTLMSVVSRVRDLRQQGVEFAGRCHGCGAVLPADERRRRWCLDACRRRWETDRAREKRQAERGYHPQERVCEAPDCDNAISAEALPHKRYCSARCQHRGEKERARQRRNLRQGIPAEDPGRPARTVGTVAESSGATRGS